MTQRGPDGVAWPRRSTALPGHEPSTTLKLAIMPKQPAWWTWVVTVALLAVGLTGHPAGYLTAILLSLAQTAFFLRRTGRLDAMSVQIRLAYSLLLMLCLYPSLRWLYWLPTLGTTALLVFGYCLMARTLSLLPWNRTEALSLDLVRRTFLSPPVVTRRHVRAACGGREGVCELEARAASFASHSSTSTPNPNPLIP